MEILHSTGRKSDWQRREDTLPAERNDMSSWATTIKAALSTVKRYKKGIIREKNCNFPEQDEDIETGLFNKTKEHSISVAGVHVHAQILSPWEMAPPARLLLMGGEGKENAVTEQTCRLPATALQLWAMPTPTASLLTHSHSPLPQKQKDPPMKSAQGLIFPFLGRLSNHCLCC